MSDPTLRRDGPISVPTIEEPLGAGLDWGRHDLPFAGLALHRSHLLLTVTLAALFVLLSWVPLWHTDVWGHLRFGAWIVTEGRLPVHEPFCPYADPDTPLLQTFWLAQAGGYLIWSLGTHLASGNPVGGVLALRGTHAALVTLRLLVLFLALRRRGCPTLLAWGGLTIVALLCAGHLAVLRPQVVGELCLALVLLALSRPGGLSRRALVLVPLLLAGWANCHGSYAAGLGLLGLCVLGRAVEVDGLGEFWRLRWLRQDSAGGRLLMVFAFSVTAVALLNPRGPWIFSDTLRMAGHPNVLLMDEWQPLFPGKPQAVHWIYLASLVVVALTQVLAPRRLSPTQFLLILAFGAAPLWHQRLVVFWLLVLPWLVLPQWKRASSAETEATENPPDLRRTIFAVLIVAIALVWSSPGQWLVTRELPEYGKAVSAATPWQVAAQLTNPEERRFPELVPITEAFPNGHFQGTIFASETLGDYLLWALPADMPVFVYSHVHLFTPEHWRECSIVKRSEPGWSAVLHRNRVNLIVVEAEVHPGLRAVLRASPEWRILVDETGDARKRDSRTRLLIALRRHPL